QHAHGDAPSVDFDLVDHSRFAVPGERNLARLEARRPHVHRHQPRGLHLRADDTARGLDLDHALSGEAFLEDEARAAACAVAALLNLAAIGIPDAIAEIVLRGERPFDEEKLVAADPEMAIGDRAYLLARESNRLANAIEHDEVVALSLHLRELELHFF